MAMEEENIKKQQDYLKNSLIYQMSLGSKELYHSNVWAWLLEKEHKYIKAFFDINLDEYDGKFEVRRELLHRDITIWLHKKGFPENKGKCYLVVENKIKSLPTVEQLKQYTEDVGNNILIGATYTGIKSTLDPENNSVTNEKRNKTITWNFRSYKDIAAKLEEITNASSERAIKKHKSQIMEYCKIVKTLNDLLERSLDMNKDMLNYKMVADLDNEQIRLSDVFKKLKGADFLSYLQEQERKNELEQFCPDGYHLYFWPSYNNKHATLDIRLCNDSKKCPYVNLGIQIEELQYRRMALIDEQTMDWLRVNKPADKLFELLSDNWFDKNFDLKIKERSIWGKTTKMKRLFDSYVSKQYCFIYQYCNINEQNKNMLYSDLFNCIKEDLKKAKEIVETGVF